MERASVGYAYLWKYQVREGAEGRFERLYGPEGDWARFFAGSPSYLGTELLRDEEEGRYVTLDRWTSREAHRRFVAEHHEEWERLDALGEELTVKEVRIGEFVPVGSV